MQSNSASIYVQAIVPKGGVGHENMGLAMASPLIVQAVEKVDLVVAKLQELQHNISTTRNCLRASQSGRERSKQLVKPNNNRMGVRRKSRNPAIKAEAKRLQESPPPWALQRTNGIIDMRGGKHLPRMKDVLAIEDHDILALPPAEGEWRRWSEPAGAIHQAVSEILVATQYAKEMAGIISESLKENEALEANAPGSGEDRKLKSSTKAGIGGAGPPRKLLVRRSQTKSLVEKKIATKAAHKFKVVFPYEGSPENIPDAPCTTRTGEPHKAESLPSPSSLPRRYVCPKAKDIKRPGTPKEVEGSVAKKDAESCVPRKKGAPGAQEIARGGKIPSGSDSKTVEPRGKTPSSKVAAAPKLVEIHRAKPEVEQTYIEECNPEVKAVPRQATEIKKPWNFSSKVVMFSNPTFVPTPKPSTKGWIGRRLSYEGSGLKRLSLSLRSSSAGKNLPALISALPARRKSADAAQLAPESGSTQSSSLSRAQELPLPPGRLHQGKARQAGSNSQGPFQVCAPAVSEVAPRKGLASCKLKVRDSNVGRPNARTSASGQKGAAPVEGKVCRIIPSGEILSAKDSVDEPGCLARSGDLLANTRAAMDPGSRQEDNFMGTPCDGSPTHPAKFASGKENMFLAGCAPGVDFLRRSWSHGNERILTLGRSPAGRSLLKRAKGWMTFQETSSRRDSLGRASIRH